MIPSILIGFGVGLLPMYAALLSRNSWRRYAMEADKLRRPTKRDALGRWSR